MERKGEMDNIGATVPLKLLNPARHTWKNSPCSDNGEFSWLVLGLALWRNNSPGPHSSLALALFSGRFLLGHDLSEMAVEKCILYGICTALAADFQLVQI